MVYLCRRLLFMDAERYKLLSRIESPADLRHLPVTDLPALCSELRGWIVECCSRNPGHLASSLGAVELTVALHYVFNTPEDRLVWDVGHQAYSHKILTGRADRFTSNRQMGGLRPFPSPLESEYDSFVCGHASNSISAALGMCVASGGKRRVVAVIGDGSMSGGLAFEGLNNASGIDNDLLIVLNDNDMSIDRSVGGLRSYLLRLNTGQGYNRFRDKVGRWLRGRGKLTRERRGRIIRFSNAMKASLAGQQNIFEGLNIRYFGPFDGHDVCQMVDYLRRIKDMKGPKLLHLHTVKGYGYAPAMSGGSVWHAPGVFDVKSGERKKEDCSSLPPKYQDVFGHTLLELAEMNPRIVGVTPAMLSGCSMNIMNEKMPYRVFDVGIAEGHAVTFSAGMAKEGLMPFCNIYSSFSQRAYDNIIHDVAILGLPVVICLDRAGLVGEDGVTHHGVFDMASLRVVPNLTIASPMNEKELRCLMYTAQLPDMGTWVLRYPRSRGVEVDWRCDFEPVRPGTGRRLREGEGTVVLSIGPVGNVAAEAIDDVERKKGCRIAHYDMRFLKPLDEDIMKTVLQGFQYVVTVEDGQRDGGFGSAVSEWLLDHGYGGSVLRLGIADRFVEHGSLNELHALAGLDRDGIRTGIESLF